MGKIVAMGGGELREFETILLDKTAIANTGKSNPRALFIPTASSDADGYYEIFCHVYGETLSCETDVLYLIRENLTPDQIKAKIEAADLVYVGGGNTLKMMKRWRKLGVDVLLKNAYQRGVVMSGLSAGAICWFAYGHSDSMAYHNNPQWKHIRVRGLGLANAIFCPHLDSENRTEPFRQMLKKYPQQVGIACEDTCAIEIVDETYRIIGRGNAYQFTSQRGKVHQEQIEKSETYAPLSNLLGTGV